MACDKDYNTNQDRIFAETRATPEPFRFDERVAEVFPDMLRRSIPGYQTSLNMIELFASRLARPGSRMYDLGSSLGAAALALQKGADRKCRIVAIDNSPAMIRKSRKLLKASGTGPDIQLVCADIRDVKIKNASLVILNYTLQFLSPADRTDLIKKIYAGLLPGGGLLLSEKIKFTDSAEQDFQTDWYYAFKEYNGYSRLEISQKRSALENVLIPDTWDTHRQRLHAAGFESIHLWQRFFSFASIVAIK